MKDIEINQDLLNRLINTTERLEQVTKLEDWWNRNGYAHLSRNGVWNEDKYSTNKDGTIPNSTVYPSGHPLAS